MSNPPDPPKPAWWEAGPDATADKEGRLLETELFWRDHQPWLKECGYVLRPRYQPDWVASWLGTEKDWGDCEDGQFFSFERIMDATRESDGVRVLLKKIKLPAQAIEVGIARKFSSEAFRDPRNRCVPIYDVLEPRDDPNVVLLVMPLLFPYDQSEFSTVGEVVEFFGQLIEGLQFMHHHHVAHCDFKWNNVMMDASPLYPTPIHPVNHERAHDYSRLPKPWTRTEKPVKYYIIDFGLSREFPPEETNPRMEPGFGGDQSVPEFKSDESCDPFKVDIYCLGNIFRSMFTEGCAFATKKRGLGFMKPLIADMTQDDPQKRPTMDEVAERFTTMRHGLGSWKLRSRVPEGDETTLERTFLSIPHWLQQFRYILRRKNSIPTP